MEFCWVLVTGQLCATDCLGQTTDLPVEAPGLPACAPAAVWGHGAQMLSCYVHGDYFLKHFFRISGVFFCFVFLFS